MDSRGLDSPYVHALDLIDRRLADGSLELTPEFLKDLHKAVTDGLGREGDPHFKPRHEGEWRDGQAFVVDRITQKVMHEGPPQAEVEPRMIGMFQWLADKLGRKPQRGRRALAPAAWTLSV